MNRFLSADQKLCAFLKAASKGLALVCCIAVMSSLSAQVSLNQLNLDQSTYLCQPGVINKSPGKGVSLTYVLNPNYSLRSIATDARSNVKNNERWEASLKVPLVVQSHFKAMLGFKYSLERFHLSSVDEVSFPLLNRLNESELKTAEAAAYFVIPVNQKYYTSFRLSASYNGDYENFVSLDNRFALYRAAGVFGVKENDYLEYGGGLMYSSRYGESSIVPFGFYNRTFNDKWGLELTIPVSLKARYNFSEGFMVLFGTEFSSQRYALAVKEPVSNPFFHQEEKAPYQYSRSTFNLTSTFNYQLTGWTWLQFKAGYAFGMRSRAIHLASDTEYNLKASNNFLGVMSIFLTPPRYCK